MIVAKCEFTRKPCPKIIQTQDGPFPVWALIKRLSAYPSATQEREGERIHTTTIGRDYVFKQNTPRTAAEIYSTSSNLGPFTLHSCAHCAKAITEILQQLDYVKPSK